MNKSNKLLSDITAFRTYAKFLSHLGRRETLEETINRCMNMHLERFPKLSKDIVKSFQRVHDLKVVPSMRSMQFSGDAILKNNSRQFNCSFSPADDVKMFSEALFLLLSGVGVGFSVQKLHVNKLPKIRQPKESFLYTVHDSIEGWAESLNILMESYFYGKIRPEFDFGQIRAKGSYLVTTGAKAPGPEPLKSMLKLVEERLKLAVGRKLRPIEVHDIVCISSDAVLAGGIRRAALISLFDKDDQEMLTCKHGEWWNKHPHRARANNSAVLNRQTTTKEEFDHIFKMCQDSKAGEPGFFWTNDENIGTNPCSEISLLPNQFCNLTSINQSNIKDKRDFLNRVYAATLIGTVQATYTDFPYLRPIWTENTESEALLGVSFTGIADGSGLVTNEWLKEGAELAKEVNKKYAQKLGINSAARICTLKPEGSASCVLGSSSGIHARHAQHYIRRIRMNKDDALAVYLKSVIPDLVEDDILSSTGVVVSIPQESPKGSILRESEDCFSLFNRALDYNQNWIKNGHISGKNTHNVSVTISVKDEEWDELREKMWENREKYTGISLLPYDGGTYQQAPFEECTKEKFEELSSLLTEIDLSKVKENEDKTERMEQLACVGGICVIE
jgi:ribonucleoside-triphosphate reductase (thioredoxin)